MTRARRGSSSGPRLASGIMWTSSAFGEKPVGGQREEVGWRSRYSPKVWKAVTTPVMPSGRPIGVR